MRIESNLYVIASGRLGFDISNPFDCTVYLFDYGDGLICFDAGAGLDIDLIYQNLIAEGLEIEDLNYIFLTHAHADHSGGAAQLQAASQASVIAGPQTSSIVAGADEVAISLPQARHAGVYPEDYRYEPCHVDSEIADGESIELGTLRIEAIATPGHSHDHLSYRVVRGERTYLLAGDAIFYGGRVVLQNTWDCDLPRSIESIERLAAIPFDALLPGHHLFSLQRGKRHVETALDAIRLLDAPAALRP